MPITSRSVFVEQDVHTTNKHCKSLFGDFTKVATNSKQVRFTNTLPDFIPLANDKPMVSSDYLDTLLARGETVQVDKKGKGKANTFPSIMKCSINKGLSMGASEAGSLVVDGELGAAAVVQKERDVAVAFDVATSTAATNQAKVAEKCMLSAHEQ